LALSDLQRAGIGGALILGGIALGGILGVDLIDRVAKAQQEDTHFIPGVTPIQDRRDCLNDQLKQMNRFNRQTIYNATVDCEQTIQSQEGHAAMRGK